MTAGSYGSNPNLLDKTGHVETRVWSGGDGRTESYAGQERDKWNNYSCVRLYRDRPNRVYSYFRPGASCGNYWITNATLLVEDPAPNITWSSNDELKLQNKLLGKVRGHKLNLAVNLAELRQTSNMVVGSLRTLTGAAWQLRRGNFLGAARALGLTNKRKTRLAADDISGRWLELQYGWLPLIGDTYEAVKAFRELTKKARSTTFRVREEKNRIFTKSSSVVSWDVKEMYSRGIQYEMYEDMSAVRSLGLTNPYSVAWEVIPFSFVADWFIPVGTYLENLHQIPRLKGRFLTTQFRRTEGYFNFRMTPGTACCSQLSIPCKTDRAMRIGMVRTVSTSLSPPLPQFDLRGAASVKRVLNAISLAQLAFIPNLLRGKGNFGQV